MRHLLVVSLFFAAALACGPAGSQAPGALGAPTPGETEGAQAASQAQSNEQILAALKAGRYTDAIRSARKARFSDAEVDFAVGELILQGLSDPAAVQPPAESPVEAIALIEKSALAGHRQAISALAAIYYTGLREGSTNAALIAPDAPLHDCWEAAKSDPQRSAACVAMRLRR